MGLHLAALMTGAAVGGLVTYVVKDEQVRKSVEDFIDGTGAAFSRLLQKMTPNQDEAAAPEVLEAGTGDDEKDPAAAPADRPAGEQERAMH